MTEDINNTESGERVSLYSLFKEKRYRIEIPIIQRDYAHGRESKKDVRDDFLEALMKYLEDNLPNRDLDFIYGSLLKGTKDDIRFIPLDGQQRLTTLFLLHWFLANLDDEVDEFKSVFTSESTSNGKVIIKSNFTYETRTSSTEFCDKLVEFEIDFNNLLEPNENKSNSLSGTIKNQNWYHISWGDDPTIQGMLLMLDAIHEKFTNTTNFYSRLTNLDKPIITFQFLNLKEFNLTDDLYIKMNARGKPLNPFENLKAKLEQLVKKSTYNKSHDYYIIYKDKHIPKTVQEYFSFNIDTKWSSLFWKIYKEINEGKSTKEKHSYDSLVMNFFHNFLVNYYAAKNSGKKHLENINQLLKHKKDSDVSFSFYAGLGCINEEFVCSLIDLLDKLYEYYVERNNSYKILPNCFYYSEESTFRRNVENNYSNYNQRIQYYGFCQFLIKHGVTDNFSDWMRVVYNLTENHIYNNSTEYINSIRTIDHLSQNSSDIVNHLTTINIKSSYFHKMQLIEERIKSILIKKGVKWESSIKNAEQHDYFTGQIGFLLSFSEIDGYYDNNSNLDWSPAEDNSYYNVFTIYNSKAKAVFLDNGLKHFNNYIWERALLTKGFYFLKEGYNNSACIKIDRDISWKRLLLDGGQEDYLKKDKRSLVKNLFDDIDYDIANIENSLQKIIKREKGNVIEWYKDFIETPELFDYLGAKRFIRIESGKNELKWYVNVFLLKGERMSGAHRELRTSSFFINNIQGRKDKYAPFASGGYYDPSGREDEPCTYICDFKYKKGDYEIDIYYDAPDDTYRLEFYNDNDNAIPNKIGNVMTSSNFQLMDHYYTRTGINSKSLKRILRKTCINLSNI